MTKNNYSFVKGQYAGNVKNETEVITFFDGRKFMGRDIDGDFRIGGDEKRLVHGIFQLNGQGGNSSYNTFPGGNSSGPTHLFINNDPTSGYNTNYTDCFVDIYEVNGTYNLLGEKQHFTDAVQFYDFLRANASITSGKYDYTNIAVVYDIIDNGIKPISKINGINTFFSYLKGSGTRYKTHTTHADNGTKSGVVQDLIRNCTTDTSYTYNASDEPRKVIRTPANYRRYYGMLRNGGLLDFTSASDRKITNGSSISNDNGTYYIDDGHTKYIIFDIGTFSITGVIDKDDIKNITAYMFDTGVSIGLAYNIRRNVGFGTYNQGVFVKPLGIDTLYIDYIDTTKYELYGYYEGKNKYNNIHRLSQDSSYIDGNVGRLEKSEWMKGYINNGTSSFGMSRDYQVPSLKFFLRDKTTKKISPLSNMKLQWATARRDRPMFTFIN